MPIARASTKRGEQGIRNREPLAGAQAVAPAARVDALVISPATLGLRLAAPVAQRIEHPRASPELAQARLRSAADRPALDHVYQQHDDRDYQQDVQHPAQSRAGHEAKEPE